MTSLRLSEERLSALAGALDLDLSTMDICYPCLSFVSFPLADGDITRARREARRVAPDLWDEGLEGQAVASLGRARDAGVRDAGAALLQVEVGGGRSPVVRAIVLRLAADLAERTAREDDLIAAASTRLPLAPPELN
jgi:hypothetical protein